VPIDCAAYRYTRAKMVRFDSAPIYRGSKPSFCRHAVAQGLTGISGVRGMARVVSHRRAIWCDLAATGRRRLAIGGRSARIARREVSRCLWGCKNSGRVAETAICRRNAILAPHSQQTKYGGRIAPRLCDAAKSTGCEPDDTYLNSGVASPSVRRREHDGGRRRSVLELQHSARALVRRDFPRAR
jgi:hypothetical protein